MIIEIDYNSEVPIYDQLRKQIVIGIASGQLKKGERLPSVRALGEELGINLHTVRKAYNILKDEGYLVIDRRVGAMVSDGFTIREDEKLDEDLLFLISRAKLKGLSKKDMQDRISSLYDSLEEKI